VLINWLSKCRGGTTPPTLGRCRAVMGALHASRPHDPSLLSDERARRAFGQCRYRPWPPKSELLLRLPLTRFPLEALTDRICRRDALVC